MRRATFGSLALLLFNGASALAQAVAPKAEQEGGSSQVWLVMLIPVLAFVFFFIMVSKARKTYTGAVDRSLQIGEESLQIARQQLAMQAETNRLLGQLLSEQGRGNRT